MAIDPFGTTSTSTTTSSASNSMSQLSEDYESFITLLTAQIQNQNPLEPMDSTTFISQLAQLSQVEQSVATNSNLEGISDQLASMGAITGLSLIGRSVVTATDAVALAEDGGSAEMSYVLAAEAATATLTVTSEDGTVLRSYTGLDTSAGSRHTVVWDGLDYEGLPLPAGNYKMTLEAVDAEGNAIASQTYAPLKVDSMTYENGLATLHLENGETVLAGLIEEII
ncbi:flagellar hook assembly protein FlgD [Yangia mangrovi]|uniref:Basal-body rod modification protein FlgD n=1 Tax=Alloyangia mangrovi TaxID=1779329 RepID=A0A2A3JWW3_9RHOB|nr:flagellar hook capping FlgD N-terminal domain-containing protein [Alloyangia mangrovi]MCT4369482.1 flagellar hook assembly protein FlgD [Alloyangia mangrovi]